MFSTLLAASQSGEGEPDYFPFDKVMTYLSKRGEESIVESMMADERSKAEADFARYADLDIGDALADKNARVDEVAAPYYVLGKTGEGEDQPGAELQGYWFMRNAKIFAKLHDVTEPGDRVVIVYGLGHKHWLEHLVANTPGYALVDPVPYLKSE